MHILIGICLALGLLYGWLVGWWFARVVVFLVLAAVLAFIGAACLVVPSTPATATAGAFIGTALAWPLASIPHYVSRYQDRKFSRMSIAELAIYQHRYPAARAALDLRKMRLLSTEPVERPTLPPSEVMAETRRVDMVILIIMFGVLAAGVATAVWF